MSPALALRAERAAAEAAEPGGIHFRPAIDEIQKGSHGTLVPWESKRNKNAELSAWSLAVIEALKEEVLS